MLNMKEVMDSSWSVGEAAAVYLSLVLVLSAFMRILSRPTLGL